MENQKSGYIPLYRSVLKQAWAKDVYLRTLWENLLLNAARKPFMARFKGHDWHLQPGQLVVTAADLGLQLCDRKGNATITDMQTRQRDVAALDAKYTKELADAQAENDRLRADVVAGKRRLQIAATCTKDETTGASGLADGSSPRLTADAELNYWRLRDGIATVTKQLTGLQAYVRTQCLR